MFSSYEWLPNLEMVMSGFCSICSRADLSCLCITDTSTLISCRCTVIKITASSLKQENYNFFVCPAQRSPPHPPGHVHGKQLHFKDGCRRVRKDSSWNRLHYLKHNNNNVIISVICYEVGGTWARVIPKPISVIFNFAWYWTTSACMS